MFVIMDFYVMTGMIMIVRAMLTSVFMVVYMRITAVSVFVHMLVKMVVGVLVVMLVSMLFFSMEMFMSVRVSMFMFVPVLMFVLSFHSCTSFYRIWMPFMVLSNLEALRLFCQEFFIVTSLRVISGLI